MEITETLKRGGRPFKKIDGDLIAKKISEGQTLKQISEHFNCDRSTIYKRFGHKVKEGRELAWQEERRKTELYLRGINV